MTIPSNHMTTNGNRDVANWCKVVLSALVPCILGIFTIMFTLQQQSLSRKQHELDQQNQLDAQRQTLFDAYIGDISNLLLHTSDTNRTREKKFLLYVRTKTLTALRNLNSQRKKFILLFLYESGFLQDSSLDLSGADLDDVQLVGPYKLDHLYLPSVFWRNALFIDCSLIKAVFDQSHMNNARFINSTVELASARETLLDNVHFIRTSVLSINFTGASLVRANFLDADVVQNIDFINADLSEARFTENQFQGKRFGNLPHNFSHAHLPNGSFGYVNSRQNLIKNGDAETQCSTGGRKEWQAIQIRDGLSVVQLSLADITNITLTNHNWGKCMFRMMNKTARVSQFIDLRRYSRLIDMDKAMYSSSAFFGCNGSTNATYVEVTAHGRDGNLVETQAYLSKNNSSQFSLANFEILEGRTENEANDDVLMHPYGIKGYRLPKYTFKVRISFGVKSTLEADIWCYFDNITFSIQEYHN